MSAPALPARVEQDDHAAREAVAAA
jgi:hypothetical protein